MITSSKQLQTSMSHVSRDWLRRRKEKEEMVAKVVKASDNHDDAIMMTLPSE
jgi:hypothetical protein